MGRMMSWGFVISLLIVGCGVNSPTPNDSAPVTPTVGDSTATVPPTVSESPEPTVEIQSIDVVESLEEWAVLAGPSTSLIGGVGVGDDVVALVASASAGEAVVRATQTGEDVFEPGPGWIVQSVFVVEDTIAFLVSSDDSAVSRVMTWDGDQPPETVYEATGSPYFIGELAAIDQGIAFSRMDERGRVCIQRNDLTLAKAPELIICGDPDTDLAWVSADLDTLSVVVFDGVDGCGTLMRWSAESDIVPIRGANCVFHGVAGDATAVWSAPPIPDAEGSFNYFDVPMYGAGLAQSVYLGQGVAGSAVVCEDVAYWLSASPEADEIRSWAPGTNVTVIYRSPDEGRGKAYSTSKPICGDGFIGLQRASWEAGAPDEVLVNIDPEWTVAFDVVESSGPDASGYVGSLQADPLLADWAASRTDLEQLAVLACEEIEGEAEEDRVAYIYSDETQQLWSERAGFTDLAQLFAWRQAATLHMCSDYYLLTIGD